MEPQVKGALIIGAAIVIGVAIWVYFSPFNSCVRSLTNSRAELVCAKALGGDL